MSQITFNQKYSSVKPYYLGLDIGTNSVGWAITNEKYEIVKRGRKSLWGVRIFQEAESAEQRRLFRSARRRRKRLKTRIKLLQEYFAEEICKVDSGFYQRMKDSFYYQEDKTVKEKFSLFNDKNFTDKEYYEKYPTIYHLRQELIESTEKHDVRLVYLACHHIMQHRGHFLWVGTEFKLDQQVEKALIELNQEYKEIFETSLWQEDKYIEITKCLTDVSKNSSDRAKELQAFLSSKSMQNKEICKLIVGNSAKVKTFLDFKDYDEDPKSIKFSDANYESEQHDEVISILGEYSDLLITAYAVYTASLLEQLLRDKHGELYKTLSASRIAIYEQHAEDLRELKNIIKRAESLLGSTGAYKEVFRTNKNKINNYVAYTGSCDSKDVKSAECSCNQEEFNNYLKGKLEKLKKDVSNKYAEQLSDEVEFLLEDLDRLIFKVKEKTFMPKITSSSNGVIPHQIHAIELERILENASGYLSFLSNEVIDEIMQLFKFRIPYYVGPFDDRDERSEFSWLKRRTNEAIRPWNLEQVVDVPATAENFIRRMTNKCTYLLGEDVLPKESLLYSEFLARQSLNMLKVDGYRLDDDKREELYNILFVRDFGKKLTRKNVILALKSIGIDATNESLEGMDQEIPVKLKALHDFREFLDKKQLKYKEVEEIIFKITIFPDSRKLIESWLKAEYSDKLSEEEIVKISKLKYAGWGRLSRKMLTDVTHTFPDGVTHSIISYMREKPVLLMELLHEDKLEYSHQIDALNNNKIDASNVISDEFLDSVMLSPAVKKAVRQVLLICKELFGIMGGQPTKIFIEMAREHQNEKKRTVSRKEHLKALYKDIEDENEIWEKVLNGFEEDKFKSKKLYLYSTQMGKCMYSGQIIDINDLFDNNKYDIDHIYPRSLTKDDSWDNLVLVKQELNRSKSDKEISAEIINANIDWWTDLLKYTFISREKYSRLTRREKLGTKELDGFLNRQLVETRQSTKAISDIFTRLFKETKIVFVKAGLVSDFRYKDGIDKNNTTQFYFPKVRIINDFHHAKDAYLNIVVGNCYNVKFTKQFYKKLHDGMQRQYNLSKFFDCEIRDNKEQAWIPGDKGTISTVNKMMARNDVLITYEAHRVSGGFFDQMLMKKGTGQYPIKSTVPALKDIKKYGGYNKVSGSHFCVVNHKKGKKRKSELVTIPTYLNKYNFSEESVLNYLSNQGYEEPVILEKEIKYWSIIEFGGCLYRIKAKTSGRFKCAPAIQAYYPPEIVCYIRTLERANKNKIYDNVDSNDLINIFDYLTEKLNSCPFNTYNVFQKQGDKIKKSRDRFLLQDKSKQVEAIMNILQLLKGDGEPIDLTSIYVNKKGQPTGPSVGVFSIAIEDKNDNKLCLINRSITGFFENKKEIF